MTLTALSPSIAVILGVAVAVLLRASGVTLIGATLVGGAAYYAIITLAFHLSAQMIEPP